MKAWCGPYRWRASRSPACSGGAIPTIAPFLLPKALPLLKKKFPRLRLQMREDLTARSIDALRAWYAGCRPNRATL
ncbi:MAG: hypothetical protein R3C16_10620 [Hyphomonadaceae bacterium]